MGRKEENTRESGCPNFNYQRREKHGKRPINPLQKALMHKSPPTVKRE